MKQRWNSFTHPHYSERESSGEHEREVVVGCERRKAGDDRRQQHRREDDLHSAELLGQHASEQVREDVAVEVGAEQQALVRLAPVEGVVHVGPVRKLRECFSHVFARRFGHRNDDDREIDAQHVRREAGHKQHNADIESNRNPGCKQTSDD